MKQDAGVVRIDGDDIAKLPSDQLAKRISVLRQDNHLAVRLTVEELVAFGRYPHSKGRPTLDDKQHIEAAIDYLELQPLRRRFLDALSGGPRPRAFVAMALCPVTDELDKTVGLVLHDINFASTYADSIVAMRDGCVVQHAAPDQVMTPPVLREIYDMDVNVHEIDGRQIGVYFG